MFETMYGIFIGNVYQLLILEKHVKCVEMIRFVNLCIFAIF